MFGVGVIGGVLVELVVSLMPPSEDCTVEELSKLSRHFLSIVVVLILKVGPRVPEKAIERKDATRVRSWGSKWSRMVEKVMNLGAKIRFEVWVDM